MTTRPTPGGFVFPTALGRILLDPEAPTEGVPTEAPAKPEAPAKTEPDKPAAPQPVMITPEQFQHYMQTERSLHELRSAQDAAAAAAEAERQKVLLEKGQAETLAKELQEKVAATESQWREKFDAVRRRYHDTERARAIAEAAAGRQFASDHARSMALRELANRVEVHEAEDGTISVRQPGTGQPASAYLTSLLDGDEFKHFLAASSTGGTGATTGQKPGQQPPGNDGDISAKLFQSWQQSRPGRGLLG